MLTIAPIGYDAAQGLVSTRQRRSMAVVWQNPTTRKFSKVAEINELVEGEFVFQYSDNAKTDPEFIKLAEFPNLETIYHIKGIPAFLSNRIMSSRRQSFAVYRNWLGLADIDDDLPMEILVRSGGQRETDTYHVVETPLLNSTKFRSQFFVNGIRWVNGAEARLEHVKPGDKLILIDQPHNAHNAKAKLVAKSQVGELGWVPDWLVDQIHEIRDEFDLTCTVEKVNLDAPMHLRLLVRIDGDRYANC